MPVTAVHANPDPVAHGGLLLARARAALDRVQEITGNDGSVGHSPLDLTAALHALATTYQSLPRAQRQQARAFLARPDSGSACQDGTACYARPSDEQSDCTAKICVHYVPTSSDATNGVDPEDDGLGPFAGTASNGIPDIVDFTLSVFDHVNSTYVNAGERQVRTRIRISPTLPCQ